MSEKITPIKAATSGGVATITLSRPLQAIDRNFDTLTLREPTGADLSECGYPTRFTPNGSTEFDTPAMTRMIARLAGIPLASANAMPASDWNACAVAIAGFLGGLAANA